MSTGGCRNGSAGALGTLKQRLSSDRLQFVHEQGGVVLNYEQLKVWDANRRILAAGFEKNNDAYAINVETAGAAYPITIDPISTTAAATLESNQVSAQMGVSVGSAGDVNGDGYSEVIVGLPKVLAQATENSKSGCPIKQATAF